MKPFILIIIGLLFFSSCATHKMTKSSKLKPKALEKNSYYVIPFDATLKSNIVWTNDNGDFQILSEVSPDAIMSSVTNLTTKLTGSLQNGDSLSAEQITQITQSVSELGQRTVAVNILRDALFRLEEFNMNLKNKEMNEQTYKLFEQILGIAQKIAIAEIETQKAKQVEAEATIETEKKEQQELKVKELTIDSDIESRYEKALKLEKDGFTNFIVGKIDDAIIAFSESEKTYPTFHSVYEMKKLLSKNRDNLIKKDRTTMLKVYNTILENFFIPNIEIHKKINEKYQDLKQ